MDSPPPFNTGVHPALWLRADAGVTSSGGAVSYWADQSVGGNDHTQGNASNQPGIASGSANFNPALTFSGNQWVQDNNGLLQVLLSLEDLICCILAVRI